MKILWLHWKDKNSMCELFKVIQDNQTYTECFHSFVNASSKTGFFV